MVSELTQTTADAGRVRYEEWQRQYKWWRRWDDLPEVTREGWRQVARQEEAENAN